MTPQSTEEFVDLMAAEISWRRKELTEIKHLVVSSSSNQSRQAALTRAALALLYAHWEGFVKAVAELYLEFVRMQRCKNCELTSNFLAVIMRSQLRAAADSNKIAAHIALVDYFRLHGETRSGLPTKKVVRTEANLSSKVFLEVLAVLGIDSSAYESKSHLLDNSLLNRRNHIAHGNVLPVAADDYLLLHDEITGLMTLFRNNVENAAVTKAFMSAT